jgi:hypothetical protein
LRENRSWTADEDALLRELRPANSFTIVARLMGRTRNGCIGRAQRLNLPKARVTQERTAPRVRPEPKPRRVPVAKPVMRLLGKPQPLPPPRDDRPGVPFHLLARGMCKWPMNDGGSCGEASDTRVYCKAHEARSRR